MKKIFFAICLASSVLTTSCDMDKSPVGALDDATAIQSLNDVSRFRNGLYESLRSLTNGGYIYKTDLQADQFQAIMTNGNRNGVIHAGIFTSADRDIESYWSSCYSVITSANYLLSSIEKMRVGNVLGGEDLLALNRYEGEAKFVRAYTYYCLVDRFCSIYTKENANSIGKGIPIVKVYYPTGDTSQYPSRSTQDEIYGFINQDLEDAYSTFKAYEEKHKENLVPDAAYLSSFAVLALQARIALGKGDNSLALKKAEEVIAANIYHLAEFTDFERMWKEDKSSEAILRPFMSSQELSESIGGAYLSTELNNADYIPSHETLSLYNDEDIRKKVYFTKWRLEVEGAKIETFVFNKYPGNEALKVGSKPNFQNMTKPFRIAEMYLVAAEAACQLEPAKANKYLNELRVKRIKGYQKVSYSGQELVDEVRKERQKELLGEGFRLSDIRRWGIGFQRGVKHPENPSIESILAVNGKGLKYEIGDYRLVWPIPSAEMQTNPHLEGQQNPGY